MAKLTVDVDTRTELVDVEFTTPAGRRFRYAGHRHHLLIALRIFEGRPAQDPFAAVFMAKAAEEIAANQVVGLTPLGAKVAAEQAVGRAVRTDPSKVNPGAEVVMDFNQVRQAEQERQSVRCVGCGRKERDCGTLTGWPTVTGNLWCGGCLSEGRHKSGMASGVAKTASNSNGVKAAANGVLPEAVTPTLALETELANLESMIEAVRGSTNVDVDELLGYLETSKATLALVINTLNTKG